MGKDPAVSSYRWVMMFLCLLGLLGQTFTWVAPAPILTFIISELKLSLGEAGSLLTIITLITGIFSFVGSFFVDKLGLKKTMVIGLGIFGLGGLLSLLAHSYPVIFTARLIVGLGFGLSVPLLGVVIMAWFPPKEQPYMNSAIVVVAYVGMTLAFMITIPILKMTGTWQNTLAVFGAYVVLVSLVWMVLGKSKASSTAAKEQAPTNKQSGLALAARRSEVWLLSAMMIGVMWTFNTFTTYLPSYFQQFRGMSAEGASAVTGFLPFAGIFGGLVCGVATGALGLRKCFTWPLFLVMLLGAIGAVSLPPGPLLYIAIGMVGFGVAGFSPIFVQIPMDLKDMTPESVGGALAIIYGVSYIVSYFVPVVFGLLVPDLGMFATLIAFGCSLLISIIAGFMIPETGPRKVYKETLEPIRA